ncbi:MAG: rhamnulokinase [Chloroflexi bacterium]|nr:rhamnulokinase [Chloroflexota bacterium]
MPTFYNSQGDTLIPSLRLLAVDLGAESGRALVGAFDGSTLILEEAHRFPNVPVRLHATLYWDFLRLFDEVQNGIRAARALGDVASLGVDTWGVDFGLIDSRGRLLANPVHYRDTRTQGMLDRALERLTTETIYATTGIQFIAINTLYQLLALVESADPDLSHADHLLMMPDLVNHFLCDSDVVEYTNATTTQCLDASTGQWASSMLASLRIPTRLFPDVVPPGTVLGQLRDDIGGRLRVIAPGTHDTASAVAAIPLPSTGGTAFLSSGTWSLLGVERQQPLLTPGARDANLTNEGGVGGTIRLLTNVMGLWLMQEARRGSTLSYAELTGLAANATPWTAFVDPDDERFLRLEPGALPDVVREMCRATGQPAPDDQATLVRVLLESLALKYAVVLHQLESATGQRIDAVHVVGGGSNNALLCQLTADACGVPVLAGPAEATALGNLIVQAMALGEVASLAEGRALVARSFPARRYGPQVDWSAARERFSTLLRAQLQGVSP